MLIVCGVCSGELTKLSAYRFVYGFRYHRFGKEGLGLIAVHTPMNSATNDFEMNSDKCFT